MIGSPHGVRSGARYAKSGLDEETVKSLVTKAGGAIVGFDKTAYSLAVHMEDDHLVRATPRARLPVPKLPPGCP